MHSRETVRSLPLVDCSEREAFDELAVFAQIKPPELGGQTSHGGCRPIWP
jgi:hypothetical protein